MVEAAHAKGGKADQGLIAWGIRKKGGKVPPYHNQNRREPLLPYFTRHD